MLKRKVQNIYEQLEYYTVIHIIGGVNGDADILIDNDDVDSVKTHKWSIVKAHSTPDAKYKYYVMGNKIGLLHRFIINCPKGLVVDHKNSNTFDNRKENLVICTNKENTRKTTKQINNKSGKKGVFWDHFCATPKWKSYIMVDRKYIHLGYFESFDDAVEARVKAEEKYFGDFKPVEDIDIYTVGVPKVQ